ncbi:hypothetical protein CUR49_00070, partial [Enterococcus faecalis]
MNLAPDPTIRRCDREHFGERVLTEELADAKKLLERALAILDKNDEPDAAALTCEAIERLIGAPPPIEQWYMM